MNKIAQVGEKKVLFKIKNSGYKNVKLKRSTFLFECLLRLLLDLTKNFIHYWFILRVIILLYFCWKLLDQFRRILMISDPAGSKQNRISINQSKISRGASIIHEGRSWLTLIQPQIFFFSSTILGLPAASWIHFKAAVRQNSKSKEKKKSKAFLYQRPKVGSNGTKQIEQEILSFFKVELK